ncbi:hypothetical protein, unlikely [Trypanosoma brucei gambiense DAL972]|uniref:T. brucei spp.-specific protein n=1 Tax=Trypanosoma brucei gambiense (strain MHOM/CI/86/DAL972) TaxID=679716 RepID=C9ZTB4_TRYB9|nr:hypothetical protein, unlikely [Trypanosoma brucei gambiense DAL972]CBH12649.1 hypothetical protein, unlikely [Trypanosoma brucei gambiense DAL972]|eukprot:XP_011774929.1 hypothetical protein, unlikely [Trypanosoma brucei gambiense DAL972]
MHPPPLCALLFLSFPLSLLFSQEEREDVRRRLQGNSLQSHTYPCWLFVYQRGCLSLLVTAYELSGGHASPSFFASFFFRPMCLVFFSLLLSPSFFWLYTFLCKGIRGERREASFISPAYVLGIKLFLGESSTERVIVVSTLICIYIYIYIHIYFFHPSS